MYHTRIYSAASAQLSFAQLYSGAPVSESESKLWPPQVSFLSFLSLSERILPSNIPVYAPAITVKRPSSELASEREAVREEGGGDEATLGDTESSLLNVFLSRFLSAVCCMPRYT